MMNKFALAFCLTLIVATYCYDETKIGQLPPDIASDLKIILKNTWNMKGDCETLKPANIKFLLYNKNNPTTGIIIDPKKPETINSKKKIVMLIHSWIGNHTSLNIQELKKAYLTRYDCNVLIVDWSETAWQPYITSSCEAPLVGRLISTFLCLLSNRLDIPLADMHVIGHGIGAHIAGAAGYNLNNVCRNKLGRITGLDPTYPMFFRIPIKDRLDVSSALFVDAIHTDVGYFGYTERIGAVDFSPNCGLHQPGCPRKSTENDTLVTDAICSHLRSIDLMTESVNSKDLVAVSCGLCPRYCSPDIITEVYTVMGEDCRAIPKPAKNFLIPTNGTSPYGLGMAPYERLSALDYTKENEFLTSLP